MTWLGVTDLSSSDAGSAVAAGQLDAVAISPENKGANGELLARGSLLVEIDFAIDSRTPAMLLRFEATQDWRRRFTIYLNADYSLSVEAQQGRARSYVRLTDTPTAPTGKARLIPTASISDSVGIPKSVLISGVSHE